MDPKHENWGYWDFVRDDERRRRLRRRLALMVAGGLIATIAFAFWWYSDFGPGSIDSLKKPSPSRRHSVPMGSP